MLLNAFIVTPASCRACAQPRRPEATDCSASAHACFSAAVSANNITVCCCCSPRNSVVVGTGLAKLPIGAMTEARPVSTCLLSASGSIVTRSSVEATGGRCIVLGVALLQTTSTNVISACSRTVPSYRPAAGRPVPASSA
eukprot:scaffold55911_cov69-Phaeocystis_antarctica.AAC.5